MKIAKEQVLDLVNDLNKLFDDKYLLKDETNGCSIMLKHEPTNITVAYVDNFEKIVVVNGSEDFRKCITDWCKELENKPKLRHATINVDINSNMEKQIRDIVQDELKKHDDNTAEQIRKQMLETSHSISRNAICLSPVDKSEMPKKHKLMFSKTREADKLNDWLSEKGYNVKQVKKILNLYLDTFENKQFIAKVKDN